MKIAIVGQPFDRVFLPVEGGSIKIWTHEVARRLAAAHEVVVYCRKGGRQAGTERFEGVEYRRVSALSEPALMAKMRWRWPASKPPFSRAFSYSTYFFRVALGARGFKPDCILIHNYSQGIPIVRAFHPRARIALLMHCLWLQQLDQRMLDGRLQRADALCGCSNFISDGIRSAFPRYASRVQTVFNGVDTQRFSPRPRSGVGRVLFAGRISPEKGIHVLLEAFERVLRRHPRAQLDLVGPGSVLTPELLADQGDDRLISDLVPLCHPGYGDAIRQRMSPAAAQAVRFHGNVPYSKLAEYYGRADVFVFPSVIPEAFGLPVAEAMASGLPVVAAKSGGIPEIVRHGQTGLLVPRGDPEALAEAIGLLLDDPGRGVRMGQAGRERAASFTWEKTVEQLLAAFDGSPSRTEPGQLLEAFPVTTVEAVEAGGRAGSPPQARGLPHTGTARGSTNRDQPRRTF
jgi:glycosyltransferase involved in cell wall biosynthesis